MFSSSETDKTLTFQALALEAVLAQNLPPDTEPGLSATRFFEPANFAFPFGAHICTVEVDGDTGQVKILRYVAVDDIGNVINPMLVDGQLHGGIAQGLGPAFLEEVVFSDDGQLLTGTFMDYAIPKAKDMPWIESERTVTPSPVNPLGAKGRRGSRDDRLASRLCQRRRRCLVSYGRRAYRHSDDAAKSLEPDQRKEPIVIASSFAYTAPETLSDALKALADDPEAKVLAGGQSLIPIMKLRLAAPPQVVDLGGIADLHFIVEEGGVIRIGSMTTHEQVEHSDLLSEKCPLLAAAAAGIGDVQVRNRGTIGGAVAHADPAADYPAAPAGSRSKRQGRRIGRRTCGGD